MSSTADYPYRTEPLREYPHERPKGLAPYSPQTGSERAILLQGVMETVPAYRPLEGGVPTSSPGKR